MVYRLSLFVFFIVIVILSLLLCSQSKAEEIEMELKVANGLTIREYYISDPEATLMQCQFVGMVYASKWMQENLGPQWRFVRLTCGPPRRSM